MFHLKTLFGFLSSFSFFNILQAKLQKFRKHTTPNAPKEVILSLISIISLPTTLDAKSDQKYSFLALIFFHLKNILTLCGPAGSHVTRNLVECKEFDYQDYVKFRQNYNLSGDVLIQFVHSSDYQ